MKNEGLQKAIERAGGQAALARGLSALAKELRAPRKLVRQSDVWYWLTRRKHGVPAEWCATIERATGVPVHELRPDIFPAPSPSLEEVA